MLDIIAKKSAFSTDESGFLCYDALCGKNAVIRPAWRERDNVHKETPVKKSILYALITVLIWSTMAPVVKLILSEVPSLEALAVSSIMAACFLFVFNLLRGKLRRLKEYSGKQIGAMTGLGFIGIFLYSALYYAGLTQMTAQEACVVNYLWPIMIMVFSIVILKERFTPVKGIAMLCSFAGIVILSLGGGAAGEGNRLIGILCCMAAAILYGLFSVLNKKLNYDQNLAMMIFWLVCAVLSAALGLCTETWIPIAGAQWIGLIWMGLASYAIAYLLWALALREAENTSLIANLAFLVPFLSVIWCAVFLKEPLQVQAVIALVLIVGGILLQSLWGRKRN